MVNDCQPAFSLFGCPAYSPFQKEGEGPPGLPHNRYVRNATVSDHEGANISLPVSSMFVLTSNPPNAPSSPARHLRGSSLQPFGLRPACSPMLKAVVATQPPRTCYPVAGQPSRTGFAPTRLCDLARPHWRCDPLYFSLLAPYTYIFLSQLVF